MRNAAIVALREVRVRMRRPAFWVLTLLVPLLLTGLYALPLWQAQRGQEPTLVLVADQSGLFQGTLQSTPDVHFRAVPDMTYGLRLMEGDEPDAVLLLVPRREYSLPREAFLYYRATPPRPEVRQVVDHQLHTLLHNALIEDVYGLDADAFHSIESTRLRLLVQDAATGREAHAEVKSAAALALALLMALALLLFGAQAMRGVQEERQTRVAEMMSASVRPVPLMAGKVGGVGLTALVQLLLWVGLAGGGIGLVRHAFSGLLGASGDPVGTLATKGEAAMAQYDTPLQVVDHTLQGLASVHFGVIVAVFALMFLLGYLLYGLLLAAVATRTDAHTESLPAALLAGSPLLAALALAPVVVQAPAGALATWLTLVPFTAPVAVVLRLPFGLPLWQVGVSSLLLLIAAAAVALLAARLLAAHRRSN